MNWFKIASSGADTAGTQEGWTDIFGDVQRHALDAYRCQVFLTKTSNKITVSVTVAHDMFGLIVYQDYWSFRLEETGAAKTTYGSVKTAVKTIFDNYESDETPNNMLHIAIREAVRYIDQEHKPDTRIPFINSARNEKGESDWRSSIYGTRYPVTPGF